MEKDDSIGACQPKILSLEEKHLFEYAGAAGGMMDKLGYPFCRGRIFEHVEEDKGQYNDIVDIDWASGAAMIVRTDLFKQLGGFDEDYFAHMEEIDFCYRLKAAGYRIVYNPNSTVYHLGGGTLNYGNPKKVFLNFRNSLSTLFKNNSMLSLLYIIPIRLILDGVAGIKFLTEGKIKSIFAIIKAHFSFYGKIPSLLRKRKKNRELIKKYGIGDKQSRSNKTFSIVFNYFVKGRKTYQ